jgi:hypothetical protein
MTSEISEIVIFQKGDNGTAADDFLFVDSSSNVEQSVYEHVPGVGEVKIYKIGRENFLFSNCKFFIVAKKFGVILEKLFLEYIVLDLNENDQIVQLTNDIQLVFGIKPNQSWGWKFLNVSSKTVELWNNYITNEISDTTIIAD